MKRLWITLAALFATGSAFAQGMAGGPPNPDKLVERLAIVLDLDDYQKGEVKRVLTAQHEKMAAAREQWKASGQRPPFEEVRAQHEAVQKETVEELRSVLTAEQLKKYEAFMAERGPRMGPPRGAPPPDQN